MRGIRDKFPSTNRGDKFRFVGVFSLVSPSPMGTIPKGKKRLIPLYKEG
jgi:hypothetical protein